MSQRFRALSVALIVLAMLACNLPGGATPTQDPGAALTAAVLTVQAELTQTAAAMPTATFTPGAPLTLPPTDTAIPPAPTSTQNCDQAQFIDDVTIPDGTELSPGVDFVKTWRLKNVGTCSWTPSYAVVFSSGAQMNGPATQALTGNVNPGQTVDISVNLKAPAAPGDYTGYWKLRNASGVLFAQFYVQIKVEAPPAGPTTVTLNATGGAEGGTVYEPGSGIAVVHGTILAGDTGGDDIARGYMSFDISGLSGVTVQSAALDLTGCTQMKNPFAGLAGIWVGEVQYALPLDQADYGISGTGIEWLHAMPGGTIDVKSYVQNRVNEGKSRFQIRLHPAGASDGDGEADYMSCGSTTPKLTITYQP